MTKGKYGILSPDLAFLVRRSLASLVKLYFMTDEPLVSRNSQLYHWSYSRWCFILTSVSMRWMYRTQRWGWLFVFFVFLSFFAPSTCTSCRNGFWYQNKCGYEGDEQRHPTGRKTCRLQCSVQLSAEITFMSHLGYLPFGRKTEDIWVSSILAVATL